MYDMQFILAKRNLDKTSSCKELVRFIARYGRLYTKMHFVYIWPDAFRESIVGCTPGAAGKEVDYIKR